MRNRFALSAAASLALAGTFGRQGGPPHVGTLVFSPNRPGSVVIAARTAERIVGLSFDDGPDPIVTPQILSALSRFDARATFFVLGRQSRAHPELIRRIASGHHEVANHTFAHFDAYRIAPSRLRDEVLATSAAIVAAGVSETRLFRPPRGLYDRRAADVVSGLGYQAIGWTLTLENFVREDVRVGAALVASGLVPGAIIVAHDGHGRTNTPRAIIALLDALRRAGYRVVTIGRLLEIAALERARKQP